jgi:hypothetical protein
MRGLDRLDGELERSVFWDDAFCSYGIYEGGPDGFVEYCQTGLASHDANHHVRSTTRHSIALKMRLGKTGTCSLAVDMSIATSGERMSGRLHTGVNSLTGSGKKLLQMPGLRVH